MKLERLHINVFIGIAALVWWLVLLVYDTPVTWEHARPFTVVVSVLVLLGLGFEHLLWRQSFLHGWFVKRPNLCGTWRVELLSSYINPKTGEPTPMIVCYMGVEQTFSELQMHLMTPESESWFIAHNIRPSPNGNGYQIIGVYTNEPNIHLRPKQISEIHQGAIVLDTHGSDVRPSSLTAKYWTDRKTTGTMNFTGRVDKVFTRFEDADLEFSQDKKIS